MLDEDFQKPEILELLRSSVPEPRSEEVQEQSSLENPSETTPVLGSLLSPPTQSGETEQSSKQSLAQD